MDNCEAFFFFFFLKGKAEAGEGALEGRVFWSRKEIGEGKKCIQMVKEVS